MQAFLNMEVVGIPVGAIVLESWEIIGLLAATLSQVKLIIEFELPKAVRVPISQICPENVVCSACSGRNFRCEAITFLRCKFLVDFICSYVDSNVFLGPCKEDTT